LRSLGMGCRGAGKGARVSGNSGDIGKNKRLKARLMTHLDREYILFENLNFVFGHLCS